MVARAQSGDGAALSKVCAEYKGLVAQLANRYSRNGRSSADVDDYRQVAYMALLRSVELWDEATAREKGAASFTSYVQRAIESRLRLHQESDYTIRVSQHHRDAHGRIIQVPISSLDAPVRSRSGEPDDATLASFVPAAADTEASADAEGRADLVRAAIGSMQIGTRARRVLFLRLLEGLTLVETGEQLGVSREIVRLVEKRYRARAFTSIRLAFARRSNALDRSLARVDRAKAGGRKRGLCAVPVRDLGTSGARVACCLPMLARGMCKAHLARWNRGERGEDLERPIGPRGPRPGHARQGRLNVDQVEAIRARVADLQQLGGRAERGAAVRALAAEHSVTPKTIYEIAAATTWKVAA